MFDTSRFNGDISRWNVSNVTNMKKMFMHSEFFGDISQWNVSKVTNMNGMFWCSVFNGDISDWDVSNVTDMSQMFKKSNFKKNISKWDVRKVKKMNSIFSEIDDNEFFTFNEKQEVRLSIAKIYCYTILVSWYNIIDIRSSDIKSSIYEIFSRIDDVDKRL